MKKFEKTNCDLTHGLQPMSLTLSQDEFIDRLSAHSDSIPCAQFHTLYTAQIKTAVDYHYGLNIPDPICSSISLLTHDHTQLKFLFRTKMFWPYYQQFFGFTSFNFIKLRILHGVFNAFLSV